MFASFGVRGPALATAPLQWGSREATGRDEPEIRQHGSQERMAGDRGNEGAPERRSRDDARQAQPPSAMAPSHGLVATRGFVAYSDAEGRRWIVREVEAHRADGTLRHCLIFESSDVVRRVWSYPDDWPALSSSGLEALSWGR